MESKSRRISPAVMFMVMIMLVTIFAVAATCIVMWRGIMCGTIRRRLKRAGDVRISGIGDGLLERIGSDGALLPELDEAGDHICLLCVARRLVRGQRLQRNLRVFQSKARNDQKKYGDFLINILNRSIIRSIGTQLVVLLGPVG